MRLLSVLTIACVALLAMPVHAEEKPATAPASSCAIEGVVNAVQKVEKSAWADGAPSPFSTVEVQISIKVDNRSASTHCKPPAPLETVTYKLCSPTPVKAGDRIKATEGVETGSVTILGCLFDVSVIPQKPTQ